MNRLLAASSRQATSSLRSSKTTVRTYPAARLLSARNFSDSATDATDNAASDDTTTTTNTPTDPNLKVGMVKTYQNSKQYGFIIPDGIDTRKHESKDLFFVHRANIQTKYYAGGERFYPGLERGLRVRFRAGPPQQGKESGQAYDVTLEDGSLVPPFQPEYLKHFVRNQKARFGEELFELFETVQDQTELETKIVAAYDKVRGDIEGQTARVHRGSEQHTESRNENA